MATSSKSQKRLSQKQQRLADQQRAIRMRNLRIGGILLIVGLALAGVYFWRTANQVPLAELQAAAAPNVDGPTDAAVRVVEFGDFGCPSCRAWHNAGIKDQLKQTYGDQVAFEFVHFPVITQQSPLAAEAAQCAAEQGAFWTYHDFLYEQMQPGQLGRASLKQAAGTLNLQQAQFDTCLDDGKYAPFVRNDWDTALEAGARGTPTFMVAGRRVDPFYESLAAAIEQALAN